jgi:hypothetical protein
MVIDLCYTVVLFNVIRRSAVSGERYQYITSLAGYTRFDLLRIMK